MFGCIEFDGNKINENLYGKKSKKKIIIYFFCVGVLKIIKLLRNILLFKFQTFESE